MIKLYLFLCVSFMTIIGHAHTVQENSAKIILRHGSLEVSLKVHENKWTEKFAVQQLDDEILKNVQIDINSSVVLLKLKQIKKIDEHYFISYVSEKSVASAVKSLKVRLPDSIGPFIVTSVRSDTKVLRAKDQVIFNF